MEYFLLFILGVIGITHIVVDSKLFAPLRDWLGKPGGWLRSKVYQIVTCYQCCGTWVGLALGLLYYENLLYVVLSAGLGSVLSNLMAQFMNYLEAGTLVNLPKND